MVTSIHASIHLATAGAGRSGLAGLAPCRWGLLGPTRTTGLGSHIPPGQVGSPCSWDDTPLSGRGHRSSVLSAGHLFLLAGARLFRFILRMRGFFLQHTKGPPPLCEGTPTVCRTPPHTPRPPHTHTWVCSTRRGRGRTWSQTRFTDAPTAIGRTYQHGDG